MGSFLDKPKTEKTNEHGQGNQLRYGLGAMQGWRIEMEDSHSAVVGLPLPGLENWSFFAVFDGHAGGTVSKFSSIELIHSILNADKELFDELARIYKNYDSQAKTTTINNNSTNDNTANNSSPTKNPTSSSDQDAAISNHLNEKPTDGDATNTTESSSESPTTNSSNNNNNNNNNSSTTPNSRSPTSTPSSTKSSDDPADVGTLTLNSSRKSTSTTTTNTNTQQSTTTIQPPSEFSSNHEERLKRAIRQGFLNLDEQLRRLPEFDKGEDKSGSTAIACLITPSHVYLINCGDSRAILVSGHRVVLGTYDHKPINPNERERIQNAGGSVMIQRVNGSLAVSRALGDYEYKCVEGRGPCEQLVSPEPEVYDYQRTSNDEFVVLACDGIWDVMSNDELMEFIHSRCRITNDLVKICNEILDLCLNKGSRDNMSLIIVAFPGAPKEDQKEIEKERICNEKIEKRVKELIDRNSSRIEFSQLLHILAEENFENLPPGGGIHAKQTFIEEIYRRLSPKSNDDENLHNANYLMNPSI